ncbi:MAG: MurR/RpiR family transcriptional regulator [Pseudomonadota bacterium]
MKSVNISNQMFRMMDASGSTFSTIDDLSRSLAGLAREGSPAVAGLAQWLVERPQEVAFNSMRGLAALAGVNVNTVYRLSVALGYSGYDECRRSFQAALRRSKGLYGERAALLADRSAGTLIDELRVATHANLDEALSGDNINKIEDAADRLIAARRIYCFGVRGCLSLAHYMAYTGSMAFRNFNRPFVEPGGIADTIAQSEAGDVVILITFSLYSREIISAHEAALSKGLDVIAITDSYASPIAQHAKLVFRLPMAGPQPLPSHGAGFALAEGIITEMISKCENAATRIASFEKNLLELGSYVASDLS